MIESATLQRKTGDSSSEHCFRLIYRSRSNLSPRLEGGEQELAEILRVSRSNNLNSDITGALALYEYKNRFAQVLEGPEQVVQSLFNKIKSDSRHDNVEVVLAEQATKRLFKRWAMTLIVEHGETDIPLMATTGGLSEAAPWRVSEEQETVLNQLRDLTRSYGRAY